MYRTLPAIDSLLAATALTRCLILVTRNIKDFMSIAVRFVRREEKDPREQLESVVQHAARAVRGDTFTARNGRNVPPGGTVAGQLARAALR